MTLVFGILLTPLAAAAQQPAKIPRIGYLVPGARGGAPHLGQAFRQGLSDLGYVEGKNVVIEFRGAEGKFERLPELAAELVRLKVDVIFAPVQRAILAAKNATQTIPIVTAAAINPVETGLVASLARPGGNITGLTVIVDPKYAGKLLQLLKEAVPQASRVAVLWNPTILGYAAQVAEMEVGARSLRVQLQILEVRSADQFEGAFAAMTRGRAEALLVLGEPMFFVHRTRLAQLATTSRLPTMLTLREYVEAGGLMSYGTSFPDLYRRAAGYVVKILKGAKPADLPMEQPTKFELVINMKTARALGLTIPQSVLFQADKIIE
ncbi:MAG: ABC transporter substrate-binding protein [Candidatus Rokubacteria bacterium]|nr:ABC transporter substrate-binding protein [Candidatus Rokubacteria bacterium]